MPLRSSGLALGVAIAAIAGTRLASADDLATKARAILKENCSECHGAKPDKLSGDLNLFVLSQLTHASRKIVVPNKPDDSEMIHRIESKDADVRMPPSDGKHNALREDSIKVLRDWIAAGAPPFAVDAALSAPARLNPRTAATPKPEELAARVKSLFRGRCFGCHGGTQTKAGIRILDHSLIVEKKKKIIPG
jgi:mono/diheme cytochrome c family protein